MTTIATFPNTMEAHLLRMRLESFGIQAFDQDENLHNLHSSAVSGVRLQVADEDVPAVRELLAEDRGV